MFSKCYERREDLPAFFLLRVERMLVRLWPGSCVIRSFVVRSSKLGPAKCRLHVRTCLVLEKISVPRTRNVTREFPLEPGARVDDGAPRTSRDSVNSSRAVCSHSLRSSRISLLPIKIAFRSSLVILVNTERARAISLSLSLNH